MDVGEFWFEEEDEGRDDVSASAADLHTKVGVVVYKVGLVGE